MPPGDKDTKNTTEFDRKALMDELNALEEAGEANMHMNRRGSTTR